MWIDLNADQSIQSLQSPVERPLSSCSNQSIQLDDTAGSAGRLLLLVVSLLAAVQTLMTAAGGQRPDARQQAAPT
jgi:hypothetical protein